MSCCINTDSIKAILVNMVTPWILIMAALAVASTETFAWMVVSTPMIHALLIILHTMFQKRDHNTKTSSMHTFDPQACQATPTAWALATRWDSHGWSPAIRKACSLSHGTKLRRLPNCQTYPKHKRINHVVDSSGKASTFQEIWAPLIVSIMDKASSERRIRWKLNQNRSAPFKRHMYTYACIYMHIDIYIYMLYIHYIYIYTYIYILYTSLFFLLMWNSRKDPSLPIWVWVCNCQSGSALACWKVSGWTWVSHTPKPKRRNWRAQMVMILQRCQQVCWWLSTWAMKRCRKKLENANLLGWVCGNMW